MFCVYRYVPNHLITFPFLSKAGTEPTPKISLLRIRHSREYAVLFNGILQASNALFGRQDEKI
jgi:hypothetical protein